MKRLAFWKRIHLAALALGWTWLAKRAKTRRFRAELALQKLDTAKLRKGETSDERDAAVEEGITPTVRRKRRAKPPKAQRSVNG